MTLDKHPVVALWMSGVNEIVDIDPQFSVTVRRMKIGKSCKRAFLKPGCKDTVIVTDKNSVRRSCMALYLDDSQWPLNLLHEVKQCKSILRL